jgi:UDP-glucose 4-epimerase
MDLSSLKGKRVLITGGLGFIGSNLAHRCNELGAEVSVFDCLDPRSGGNLYNVENIRNEISIHFHDILNFDQLTNYVINKDIIVNCAASTSHSFSMKEPWIDQDVNSRGVINILEAVRRFNKDVKLIHIGTSTQLGPLQYQPADEKHPEFPTDIYSANKCVSEKYVLIYAKAYQLRATVIRFANVFGPRASIHSPEFTFNNYFIGLALKNKKITVFGDGNQKRNVIYIDDAIDALVMSMVTEENNGKALFASGDHHYSVRQIALNTVKYICSGEVGFVEWPSDKKVIDIGDAILNNQAIKNIIKWYPTTSLEDGLTRTKIYFDECLDKYLR